jgi:hypothetical protein
MMCKKKDGDEKGEVIKKLAKDSNDQAMMPRR